jgi:excisionase family DNA binding protein
MGRKGCARACTPLSWSAVGEDYYTTGEAARILKVTEARVRQMLGAGEMEGSRDPGSDRWRIPQHAVHARLEQRRPPEAPRTSADAREWIERVTELERELGRLEGRLEITEVAESTLREQLERERERADGERDRLLREREAAQEEARRLREELETERGKGFWQRLFGG